ncbi:molecular chaperone [Vibrio tapetis]|uniref:Pili assembly chaperone N-terminal domain-containing protein n=1 Tax=Vibrio tapetis subsp. tapetis TaxID=1671868 RepID=A0A2N8ZKI0_9VIBR|nr:molecular chaperone [Vibrio tapetis]SON52402.1 conserved exported protein of unknown function [Vibrio tapetis subsp. tapetis]
MMPVKQVFFIVGLLVSSSTYAYKVQPMVAELSPIGKGAQMSMRIDNTGSDPLTVELTPFSMTMDEHGNETTQLAEDNLLVIPFTAIIPPGRSQSVMVRYLGNPSISQSKSYRISVRQVKVKKPNADSASLGLLLQFNTLLNIKPQNTHSDLSIDGIEHSKNQWLVKVKNEGNSYGRLTQTNWKISDKNQSRFIKGSELSNLVAGTLVLPKSKRTFIMEPIKGFDSDSVSIEIEDAE